MMVSSALSVEGLHVVSPELDVQGNVCCGNFRGFAER